MNDLISRQQAINALGERPMVWTDNDIYSLGQRNQYDFDRLAIEIVPSAEPQERKTGRWIETEGLEEEIRCTMCTNPMRSDRGCDGSCRYDEKLYKQIMSIIEDRIDGGGQ